MASPRALRLSKIYGNLCMGWDVASAAAAAAAAATAAAAVAAAV